MLTQALSAPADDPVATLAELRDRTEVIDALLRFALGQDLRDLRLLASAFTADAELDFRPAASRWGAAPPVMRGGENIASAILSMFEGRVTTTHQVTNARVSVDGDRAHVTALVEAQHLLTADPATRALLIRYTVRPEHVEENERLVRAILDKLRDVQPPGPRYAVLKLDDGATFIHLISHDDAARHLPARQLDALPAFHAGLRERCAAPPDQAELSVMATFAVGRSDQSPAPGVGLHGSRAGALRRRGRVADTGSC